jgi:hypothetical protein
LRSYDRELFEMSTRKSDTIIIVVIFDIELMLRLDKW